VATSILNVIVKLRDELSGGMRSITGSMLSANAGAATLQSTVELASDALRAMAGAVVGVTRDAINLNASFESSQAVIQAYTGSAEETARIMSMLQGRAANSVFSFDQMAQAVQGLIPASKMAFVPVDDLMTVAEQLGASNMAEGINGAAYALREAVAGDFTSVIERFNLPRAAINALKEQGVPALDIVRTVMSDLGIGMDLVSAQANTFNGRSDRIIENLQLMAADAAKPIFDLLSQSLEDVMQIMAEPEFQEFADTVKEIVADTVLFIEGMRDLAAMVSSSSDPLATFLDHIDLLIPSINQFVGKGREISATLRPIVTFVMNNLVPILITLAGVVGGALVAAFVAIVAPIAKVILIGGAVVAAVGAIGIGIKTLVETVQRDFPEVFTIVTDILNDIVAIFQTVFRIILALVEPVLKQIVDYWNKYGAQILQVVGVIFGVLLLAFQTGMRVLRGVVELILALIRGDWQGASDAIMRILNALWNFISTIFGGILTFLVGLAPKIATAIGNAFKAGVDSVARFLVTLLTKVIEAFNAVKNWLTGTDAKIDATKSAKSLVDSFFDFLTSAGNGLVKFVTDAFNKVKTWLSTFKLDAGAIAKTIVASLLAVLIGPAGLVIGAATKGFDALKTWLSNRTESGTSTGKSIVDSLGRRMSNTTDGLTKAASDAFAGLSTWLGARTESGAAAGASIVDSVKTRLEEAGTGLSAIVGAVFDGLGTFLKDTVARSTTLLDAAKSVGAVIVTAISDALRSTVGTSPGLMVAVRDQFEAMRAYLAGTVRLQIGTTMQYVGESIMRSLILGIRSQAENVFKNIVQPVVTGINTANQLSGNPNRVTVPGFSNTAPLPALPVPPTTGLPTIRSASAAGIVINIGSVRDQRDIDAIERAVTRGMDEAARRGIVQSQLPRGI